jgi:hypothetical protein
MNPPPTTAQLLAQARETTERARSICAESRRLVTSSRATRATPSQTRQDIHRDRRASGETALTAIVESPRTPERAARPGARG